MPTFTLELRSQRQRIDLVQLPGQTRPVIGHAEPAHDSQRVATLLQHGSAASPRSVPLGTLTEASDLRTRTVLAHRLPPALNRALAEGMTCESRVAPGGVVASVTLGGPPPRRS